jgi:hypothetical protein
MISILSRCTEETMERKQSSTPERQPWKAQPHALALMQACRRWRSTPSTVRFGDRNQFLLNTLSQKAHGRFTFDVAFKSRQDPHCVGSRQPGNGRLRVGAVGYDPSNLDIVEGFKRPIGIRACRSSIAFSGPDVEGPTLVRREACFNRGESRVVSLLFGRKGLQCGGDVLQLSEDLAQLRLGGRPIRAC